MICNFNAIEQDFLQNTKILCFCTDKNGVITHTGSGIKAFFPYSFQIGQTAWDYFDVKDFIEEITERFSNGEQDYYLTPEFLLHGRRFTILCLACRCDKVSILHILRASLVPRAITPTRLQYRSLMERYRRERFLELDTLCRANSVDSAYLNRLRAVNNTLQRSEALLTILDNPKQIGSGERALVLADLCHALNREFSLLQNQLARKIVLQYPENKDTIRLDAERFIEALASVVSIHELYAPALTLELKLMPNDAMLRLTAESRITKSELTDDEEILLAALKSIPEDFAEHYGGYSFCQVENGMLITEMGFAPLQDEDIFADDTQFFMKDEGWIDKEQLMRCIPLLRHSGIERAGA